MQVLLRVEQAIEARNALAKDVYGKMFDWIVQRVNRSMVVPTGLQVINFYFG